MDMRKIASDNHKYWLDMDVLLTVMGNLDDLLERAVRDIRAVAEREGAMLSAMGMENDITSVARSIHEMHVLGAELCHRAGLEADEFELECRKREKRRDGYS